MAEIMKLTDSGNAERLIQLYGNEIAYCPPMKSWYIWDGRIWREDTNNSIFQFAREVACSYDVEAKSYDHANPDSAKCYSSLIKWAIQSESLKSIQSMVMLTQSNNQICVDVSDFDRDPMLLNVENGTINLRTGEYGKFDSSYLITKHAPVAFIRDARCPLWERFLSEIIPDPNTRQFIQTAVGYSLTASTREDKMFILHGSGRNGKTTFINTILGLLGTYASQASSHTLMRKHDSGPKDDLFVLMGKRFVAATETGESHCLDENLVKQITGGNHISVNPKYRTQIEFMPTWKLWLDTNYEPIITGTDLAIWRRLLKIPFTVTIPESECDVSLKNILMTDLKERSGILNWAIEGALRWQSEGLIPSSEILHSTKNYCSSQDSIGQFLNDKCRLHPNLTISKAILYNAYVEYSRVNHDVIKTKNAFGRELICRNVEYSRNQSERFWTGIALDNHVSLLPHEAI